MRRTVVVTDSTAGPVPAGVDVVGLDVVVEGRPTTEESTALEGLLAALSAGAEVTTSRPSPDGFARAYARAAAGGASAVVSVHLSGALSGTVEAARLAAARAPLRVEVVDTTAAGAVLTAAVEAAAAAADDGADARRVADLARDVGTASTTWLSPAVTTHLQRGGRGGPGGRQGRDGRDGGPPRTDPRGLLRARTLLVVHEGRLVPVERARTLARVLDRLRDLVRDRLDEVAAQGGGQVLRVVVQHAGAADAAAVLLTRLHALPAARGLDLVVVPLGPVLTAHVGPGTVGVAVVVRPGRV